MMVAMVMMIMMLAVMMMAVVWNVKGIDWWLSAEEAEVFHSKRHRFGRHRKVKDTLNFDDDAVHDGNDDDDDETAGAGG